MRLEEKHKEFAVICFARFMTRTEVIDAFIEEFANDLPESPSMPEFPYDEERYANDDSIEAKLAKDQFITDNLRDYGERYGKAYPNVSSEKFDADLEQIRAEIEQSYKPKNDFAEDKRKHRANYQKKVRKHREKVKHNLSNQLRRLNITHPQFPNKYRALFEASREQYFNDYRSENLGVAENVLTELETLHGYVKHRIFAEKDPKAAMKYLNLSHQILKTIVAHNAVSGGQEVSDITPQDVKALEDTQKAITEQVKEVTQQLAEHTDTSTD